MQRVLFLLFLFFRILSDYFNMVNFHIYLTLPSIFLNHFNRKKWWIWNSGHFMVWRSLPTVSFQFLGFFLKMESSYRYPSTTQRPSSRNYSICSYEPLSFSNMKMYWSIYLLSFLRIICLLCSIECLIRDGVFPR